MSSAQSPAPTWRKVAARVALIGGLAFAVTQVTPLLPRDQDVVFRVGSSAPVRQLDVSFKAEGERAPARGLTLKFPERAPATVRHRVSLPNGRYELAISVTRELPGGLAETTHLRRVTLAGGETLVALDDAQ